MRTKLFLTFLGVIVIALLSNLIFERLIIRDFGEYTMGVEEDRLYWVMASVEGSYTVDGWDTHLLSHPMQWGTMLGYDIVVLDNSGKHVASSLEALKGVTPAMERRIKSLVHLDKPVGDYEEFPLFSEGSEIGYLMIRPLEVRRELGVKERMFRQRGRNFLLISFLIAGGSAALISVLLSLFLTHPLRRLKDAAERVARGDLGVRVAPGPRDEVGRVITSFNRMVESLEREESLRRHLTSNIAHELRTPVTVLRSNLEAVSDGILPCEPETIRSLEAEVERLTNLIAGIEDFTKAEAYLLRPAERNSVVLLDFTRSLARGMEKVFSDRDIALSITSEGAATVEVDAGKLETVLRNILANAASHATPPAGEQGRVEIRSGSTGNGGFFIEVRDNGQGIPEEEVRNIFKRFYKGKDSAGTGLGLSIAKELVSAMGGTITASGNSQGGAAFRVELPDGSSING